MKTPYAAGARQQIDVSPNSKQLLTSGGAKAKRPQIRNGVRLRRSKELMLLGCAISPSGSARVFWMLVTLLFGISFARHWRRVLAMANLFGYA